jgi:hypothetical protein
VHLRTPRRSWGVGTLVAVAAATIVAGPADRIAAAPDDGGGCTVVGWDLSCGVEVDRPSSPGRSGDDARPRDTAEAPTAQWIGTRFSETFTAGRCDYGGPDERPMLARSLLSPTGEILRTIYSCAEPETTAPPQAPPAPPTQEELVASVPIPRLEIRRNPSGRGLTGLESWFWAAEPGPTATSVTLRGWQATGSLSPDRWVWETGDGGRYVTDGPGSAEDPAVAHTYEADGTWRLSLRVEWSGTYTVSGYGTTFTVGGLSTEDTTELDYHVIEVRGVLDEPSGRT